MGKVTIYLAVFCICYMQVRSQDTDKQLIQQVKSIEKELHTLARDKSITGNCKLAVQQAIKAMPSMNGEKLDKITRDKLVNAGKNYISLSKACDISVMKNTASGFTSLVENIKASGANSQVSRPDSVQDKKTSHIVRMQIKMIDSAFKAGLNYMLVIDTFKKTIAYNKTGKDSAGFLNGILRGQQNYQLKVLPDESGKDSGKATVGAIVTLSKPGTIKEAAFKTQQADEGYERKHFKVYLDALFKKIAFLCIIVTLVSLLLSSVNVLYAYSFFKWHLLTVKQVTEYGPALVNSKDFTPPVNEIPLQPAVSIQVKEPQPEAIDQTKYTPVAMPQPVGAERYFLSEILVSAGPRKKFMSEPDADKDLGEDICGFVSDGKQLLIWLLDGTSDLHCLKNPVDKREYFSSRLLAQFIANKLRSIFATKIEEGLDLSILQVIRDVRADWLRVINQLPVEEKEILKSNIENKNIPECATTLLFGRLNINGQLTAYRSGDSKMFLFAAQGDGIKFIESTLTDKNEESNDRIFFRLVLSSEGDFDILFNLPKYEIVKAQNVHTLIAFSDGIGMATEMLLKKQYSIHPDQIRNEIIYQSQGTADDKSICFVEIKEAGAK